MKDQLIGVKVIDSKQAPDPRKAVTSKLAKITNVLKLDLTYFH